MDELKQTLEEKGGVVVSKEPLHNIVYNVYESAERSPKSHAESVNIHCSHGFGASGVSWIYFMNSLNLRGDCGAHVVAHDTYGFGFTDVEDRNIDLSLATLEANGRVSVAILSMRAHQDNDVVFMGHSMGSISAICSAVEWVEAGKSCRGVFLIAPAIQAGDFNCDCENINIFFGALGKPLALVFAAILTLATLSMRRASLAGLLTVAVNIPFFWYLLLRYAFYGAPLSDSVSLYQIPMMRNNWKDLLIDFVDANVWQRRSISNESIYCKIRKLIARNVPIVIWHCPNDTFVPYSNSEKLVEQFGGQQQQESLKLETATDGGHMPHEKCPDILCNILEKYEFI